MAKLKYTFDDYIRNPSGKGAANTGSINLDQYSTELISLEGKNAKSRFTIYNQSSSRSNKYSIHFEIPSSTKGFFHDVVIELSADSNDSNVIKTVKNYNVRFFANDSNFVYTYAYTFKTHGLLITDLEKLLPFRSLVQKPTMRNPDNAMGYNKNIIYAYIIMRDKDLFNKDTLVRLSKTGNVSSNIKSFDKKEQERRRITEDLKSSGNKKEPPKNKVIKSKNLLGDSLTQLPPKIVNKVKNTKVFSTVSSVKKVKKR